MNSCSLFCAKFIHNISSHFIYSDLESFLKKIFFCNVLVGIIGIIVLYLNSYQCYLGIRRWLQLWIFVLHALLHVPSTTVFFPPSNPQFDTANYSNIVSWHLLGHAIKSVTCFAYIVKKVMICDDDTSRNRKDKNAWEIPSMETYLTSIMIRKKRY
jgi:hypothetical protein